MERDLLFSVDISFTNRPRKQQSIKAKGAGVDCHKELYAFVLKKMCLVKGGGRMGGCNKGGNMRVDGPLARKDLKRMVVWGYHLGGKVKSNNGPYLSIQEGVNSGRPGKCEKQHIGGTGIFTKGPSDDLRRKGLIT